MSAPSLADIVRALGGDLHAGGRRANVPGPGHSAGDRSVSLRLSGDRVIVHSFAGDDWRVVRDDLVRRKLLDPQGRLPGGRAAVAETGLAPGARRRSAQALWSSGVDLVGTLSARHLAGRGVAVPQQGLRHHPGVPAAIYDDRGPRRPALLAAIRDAVGGDVVGVEVTYLASDGGRAPMSIPRKIVGQVPSGAAVRLAPARARMLVGEGVFTTLSAAARFGLPGWALLSAGNLRAWSAPAGVGFVAIAGDRGKAGQIAAWTLAARLRRSGVGCGVRFPPPSFGDWNEAEAAGALEGDAGLG